MLQAAQQISQQDARSITSTSSGTRPGTISQTNDGRVFAWAVAGSSNLSAALLAKAPSTTANHVNRTGTANAVGSTVITFTVGATAVTQDQYAGGYLVVDVVGPNIYRIKGNTSVTSAGGSITVTLSGQEPLTVATTTSSKFSLYPHPFNGTLLYPSADSGASQAVGVPNVAVTANYFYWSQVGGYCSVLADSSTAATKNQGVIASTATDGAVAVEATTTVTKRLGYAPESLTTNQYLPVVLTITQ